MKVASGIGPIAHVRNVGDSHGPLATEPVGENAEDQCSRDGTNGGGSGDDLLFR